ncbi:hypothetical protein HMPREF1557_01701 [Streptococcus sobrinus W1703]|uniref:Uncharacterized protein n=1 Tax=Streptococcus sobrinus W1703 TaxID=1227275 RepID=U2J3E7_9STRE|nr:hypothetical protein HMPREF1557_01701 [Streptococcus sobrinus W1703]
MKKLDESLVFCMPVKIRMATKKYFQKDYKNISHTYLFCSSLRPC